jgi:hypothetical protein
MAPIIAIKMAAGMTAEGAFPKAAIPGFIYSGRVQKVKNQKNKC